VNPLVLLGRLWRRAFGRYELDDPRPVVAENPYTFFVPGLEEIAALEPGDDVKLIFRSIPRAPRWGAERMWVRILAMAPEGLTGELLNEPSDMPQLHAGAQVDFQPWHIVGVDWKDEAKAQRFADLESRFFGRCMVDEDVVEGRARVGYLYRETPDLGQQGDQYPDTGWRIRGELFAGETEAAYARREPCCVALGVVLNRDDSILALLDEPVGARFTRDPATGAFLREASA